MKNRPPTGRQALRPANERLLARIPVLLLLTLAAAPAFSAGPAVLGPGTPIAATGPTVGPTALLSHLAAQGVPCGMVVDAPAWNNLPAPVLFALSPPLPEEAGPATTLGELRRQFLALRAGWDLEIGPRQVVLRRHGVPPRTDTPRSLHHHGSYHATVQRVVDLYVPPPPGTISGGSVGSYLGYAGPPEESGLDPEIAARFEQDPGWTPEIEVDIRDAGLEDLLGAVVAEVPGSFWVLVRHGRGADTYDLLETGWIPGRRRLQSFREIPAPSADPSAPEAVLERSPVLGPSTPVPTMMEAAAGRSPGQLLWHLRARGIPCGIVLDAADETVAALHATRHNPLAVWTGDRASMTTLAAVRTSFERAHPGWVFDLAGQQVILRSPRVPRRQDPPRTLRHQKGELMEVFHAVVALYAPDAAHSGGCVGTGPSSVDPETPDAPLFDLCRSPGVEVPETRGDLEDLLGAVTASLPGSAWVLERRRIDGVPADHLRYSWPPNRGVEGGVPIPLP